MKPINKAMWFELAGGIFGWIWITASVGAIYFFVQAIFYDGSWVNLVGVLLTGGISKVVLRECEARKNLLMTQESINSHNNKKSEDSGESAWTDEAEKIVQKYGEVLQHASPVAGCVADQDQLPYPKGVIKIALIKALQNTVDNDQKDALQVGYLSLANWQSDVGGSSDVIHGLRHSFRDRLRAVEAPADMIDQLGGWSLKSVGQGYGDGYDLELLVKYQSKIQLIEAVMHQRTGP